MSGIGSIYILVFSMMMMIVFAIDRIQQGDPCTTPELKAGICVPEQRCKTLRLSKNQPSNDWAVILMRKAHCGTFNSVNHVCCEHRRFDKKITARRSIDASETKVQSGIAFLQQTACGYSDDADANHFEYPWIALLVYSKPSNISSKISSNISFRCGGSLIHQRYVLTAAHCLRIQIDGSKVVSVRLGGYDTNTAQNCKSDEKCPPPVQEIDIDEAIYHKNYSPSRFVDDIGIIRLLSNAVIATNVKAICLPVSRQFEPNNTIVSGWGLYANNYTINQDKILQKAIISITSNEYCKNRFFKFLKFSQNQLCGVGDICKGDGGGPMFYRMQDGRYMQHGIFTGGDASCDSNSTGIFNNVKEYLPWIASNLQTD